MERQGLDIAVIGGGINGICCARELRAAGHRVTLFERGELMSQTSSRSSKLLHGGLRYLETGEFRLVREALGERSAWLRDCPQHARAMRIALPVYGDAPRPAWMVGCGILLYRLLEAGHGLGPAAWSGAKRFAAENPELRQEGLRGGFYFHDGQMDDRELGLWVAARSREEGVLLREHTPVERVSEHGDVATADGSLGRFDRVVNVAGPWAALLLERSGMSPAWGIDWVRGTHLLLDEPVRQPFLLQVPGERRIFFVLPYQGRMLVGTTEVAQPPGSAIEPDEAEIDYLLAALNHYMRRRYARSDVAAAFAGVRPLLRYSGDPGRASREYAVARTGRLVTVYGGKWTTARALARRVVAEVRESARQIR